MKEKIIASGIVIFSQGILKDNVLDAEHFVAARFFSVNQSHNSAIIIGSSLAHQSQDIEQDMILDSSGIRMTTDKNGVITGARVAVTDGLGGGVGDREEDEKIHRVSHVSCETFLDCNENIDATLYLISKSTVPSADKTRKELDAHASLAASTYKYRQGET